MTCSLITLPPTHPQLTTREMTTIQRGERTTLLLQTTTPIDDDHCNYKNNNCSCSMILTRRLLWSLPIIILLLGALLLALISSFSMESISMTSSSISKLTLTTNDGDNDNDNNTNNRLFPTTTTTTTTTTTAAAATTAAYKSKSKMQPQSQSLLRGKLQQPATSTSTMTEEEFNRKGTMKLSLWLIPPGGEEGEEEIDDINNNKNIDTIISHNVYKSTKEIIDELAEKYNGPKFIPHTTIIGSIEVDTEEDILVLSNRLKDKLQSSESKQLFSNGIECTFNTILQEPSCWNQAMIIEMKASKSFTDLCILCRTIFNMEQFEDCITFPPPSKVPHMSLYYGTSPNVPSSSSSIIDLSKIFGNSTSSSTNTTTTTTTNATTNNNKIEEQQNQNQKQSYSFQSYRVMLWKTDPASLEGVPNWIPIVDINLS